MSILNVAVRFYVWLLHTQCIRGYNTQFVTFIGSHLESLYICGIQRDQQRSQKLLTCGTFNLLLTTSLHLPCFNLQFHLLVPLLDEPDAYACQGRQKDNLLTIIIYSYLAILGLCCSTRGSSLLREGFLQLQRVRATLLLWWQASHCGVFSCDKAPARACTGSVVVLHGLSYPAACGILVPGPGIEHESPALAGEVVTTGPPGKFPQKIIFV